MYRCAKPARIQKRNPAGDEFDLPPGDGSIVLGAVTHDAKWQILGLDEMKPSVCFFRNQRQRPGRLVGGAVPVLAELALLFGLRITFEVSRINHRQPCFTALVSCCRPATRRFAGQRRRQIQERQAQRAMKSIERNGRGPHADEFHVFCVACSRRKDRLEPLLCQTGKSVTVRWIGSIRRSASFSNCRACQ